MELIAAIEADYIRLAVAVGMTLEEARKDWDELIMVKEEEEDGAEL